MRTTITLEPDTARLVREAMKREQRSFKEVVNAALRSALGPGRQAPAEPYRVEAHQAALRPGYDPRGFNRLADELEDDAVLARAAKGSR